MAAGNITPPIDAPAQADADFSFQLFVSNSSPTSAIALSNLQKLCDALGASWSSIEVIDVQANPAQAEAARVFAVPTLIKRSPAPTIRFLGDLADREKIMGLLKPIRVRSL